MNIKEYKDDKIKKGLYMKVIQVMPEFALAGAEIMCENLVYGLCKKGVETVVVSFYDYHSAITDRLEQSGVKIIYLNKKPGLDISIYNKLYKVFKTEKPDVIHTHRYTTRYVIPVAVRARIKYRVHTVHNVAQKESGKIGRILNKFFFKCCHTVPVALSDLVQESICKTYKMKFERVPIVFNGINLGKCIPKTDYHSKEKIKILHIGRFMEQKNHKGLIKAFALFHKQYPQSVLQLIGVGEKRKEIEGLVETLGLLDCVEFLGLQSNVYEYLHNADIFTLPSLYEGIPVTLIEAMGTGIPIVATKVGGVPDMLKDKENALLTEVDSEKIAEAFFKLANDEDMRMRLGKKVKKESEKFSAQIMTERYLEIYEGKHNA